MYLGYFFADNLDLLMEYVKDVQTLIYLILGVILLIVLIVYLKKRFHSKLSKFSDDGHHSKPAPAATAAATTADTKVASSGTTPADAQATTSAETAASASADTNTTATEQAPVESAPKS